MSNFTPKVCYTHRVENLNGPKSGENKEWVYTTRIYACDYVAVQEVGDNLQVSAFMNDGGVVLRETVFNWEKGTNEGRAQLLLGPGQDADMELCTKVIVENSQGRTSQIIQIKEH